MISWLVTEPKTLSWFCPAVRVKVSLSLLILPAISFAE